ncbi:MAG TPA: methionine--tRNA ligase [Patescibacteria group bacterium]
MKPQVSFDEFQKLDIRIGTIKAAEKVEGSGKLYKLTIDFKVFKRTILAGIAEWFKPKDLVGKQIPVILNMEPKKILGIKSEGMMMAVDVDNKAVLLQPERKVVDSSIVR